MSLDTQINEITESKTTLMSYKEFLVAISMIAELSLLPFINQNYDIKKVNFFS